MSRIMALFKERGVSVEVWWNPSDMEYSMTLDDCDYRGETIGSMRRMFEENLKENEEESPSSNKEPLPQIPIQF